jgi:hypothetical protein
VPYTTVLVKNESNVCEKGVDWRRYEQRKMVSYTPVPWRCLCEYLDPPGGYVEIWNEAGDWTRSFEEMGEER